jgi:hypothetical protein
MLDMTGTLFCLYCADDTWQTDDTTESTEDTETQSGYVVQENGKALCPGVVCRCGEGFCPAHGTDTTKDTEDVEP